MRHAAITPARSEARLGLRRPVPSSSGRHSADTADSDGALALLDAPTVVLPRVPSTPAVGNDVFAGRERLFTVGGPGRTPRELWRNASPRSRATAVVGAALALLAVGFSDAHPHASTSSSSRSSTADSSSSSSTTPLGCDVHEVHDGVWNTATDDPYCTQRRLAAELCDLDLYGRPQVAGTVQRWSGSAGEAILSGTGTTMTFTCGNTRGEEHLATFTLDEWDDLISPGSMTPTLRRELATA